MVVPTIDDIERTDKPEADYKDWKAEDTRVLVFTDDPTLYPRDRIAEHADNARALAIVIGGRILEVNEVPHRWFIRVPRVRA